MPGLVGVAQRPLAAVRGKLVGDDKVAIRNGLCLLAAGPVAAGPASARLVTVFGADLDHDRAKSIAQGLLATLDQHLEGRQWLAADGPTLADVANYSYIAHAPEGGVSLQAYPQVRAWLSRVEALPGFVPMQATAAGLAA